VNEDTKKENRRLSSKLAVVALAMFGFGFALVPFYNEICQALGMYSLEQKSDLPANSQIDASRTIRRTGGRLRERTHASALVVHAAER